MTPPYKSSMHRPVSPGFRRAGTVAGMEGENIMNKKIAALQAQIDCCNEILRKYREGEPVDLDDVDGASFAIENLKSSLSALLNR